MSCLQQWEALEPLGTTDKRKWDKYRRFQHGKVNEYETFNRGDSEETATDGDVVKMTRLKIQELVVEVETKGYMQKWYL